MFSYKEFIQNSISKAIEPSDKWSVRIFTKRENPVSQAC